MNKKVDWQAAPTTLAVAVACGFLLIQPAHAQECPPVPRQPATQELIEMLDGDTEMHDALVASIDKGQAINPDPQSNPVSELDDYYNFIDALVTYNPRNIGASFDAYDPATGPRRANIVPHMDGTNYCNWNLLDLLSYSYFLIDQQLSTDPKGTMQFSYPAFAMWLADLSNDWAKWLGTSASKQYLESEFYPDPAFRIDDYVVPSGGFASFNDFFTRQVKDGKRPIAAPDDDTIVVAIGDSQSRGYWPISANGKLAVDHEWPAPDGIWVKGKTYHDVADFVLGAKDETILKQEGSIDASIFNSGVFTHQFLNVNDYHRLHTPVAGKVVFINHIKAAARMHAAWDAGSARYAPQDGPEWQFPTTTLFDNGKMVDLFEFGQTRLVFGIQTDNYGIVLAIPMGMAQVSGIDLRNINVGDTVAKGQEFANFAFGGSDFVVIFEQKAGFELTVGHDLENTTWNGIVYQHQLQGEAYGCFNGSRPYGTCSSDSRQSRLSRER